MFISVYTDYNNNELMYSDKTHSDLQSAKYDINYIITRIIHDKFNVQITDEYLFINNPLNVKLNIIQTINVVNDIELIFIKNGLTIDIYSKQLKKGYLYNNLKEEHVYKFCIIKVNKVNKENETIPVFNNPSLLITVYGKCKQPRNNEREEIECETDTERFYASENESDNGSVIETTQEIKQPFVQQNSDLFLQELKERLKSRMKIKME
jgi:hypothetical protein